MYWATALAVALTVAHAEGSILRARQTTVPNLPTGGFGDCGNQCTPWESAIQACTPTDISDPNAGEELMKCTCTDDYIQKMASCYDCLVPLAQGEDATFASDAQSAMDDFEQACQAQGFTVSPVSISGGGGASPTTSNTSGGTDATSTPTTGGANTSPTAPAPSNGSGTSSASSAGSPTPTGGPSGSGAMGTEPAAMVVLAGLFGGALAVLGL
ncbi:hypothetical protein PsYK624_159420 [Phanerochaete sordida]|uniref:Uncharacterized protein n=1 Tax=Phanerochaete sordida TaxID=48140 RepID=A0A9P3LLM4_9APHY|nr:hypothetical protein PsYK624_159420 [Phanerochaete sordida]